MKQEFDDDSGSKPTHSISDQDKLHKSEENSEIIELIDNVERSNVRLAECRNENHVLRCNVDLVEQIMRRDVAEEYPKDIPEFEWKRMLDAILKLPTRIRSLQAQLEEVKTQSEISSEERDRRRLSLERKAFWRMELERRKAREGVLRDVNPVAEECMELRKKLDAEKARFRNLSRKVNLLRNDLQNKKLSSEESNHLVRSFHEMQNKLSDIHVEIGKLRNRMNDDYPEFKSRNDHLVEEIGSLRTRIKSIREKRKNNTHTIRTLTRKRREVKELFDSEKAHLKQNVVTYKDDVRQADENFKDLADIRDHFESLSWEKSELAQELESFIESLLLFRCQDNQSLISPSTFELDHHDLSTADTKTQDENHVGDTEVKEQNNLGDYSPGQVERLMIECAKYRALIEAAENESDRVDYLTKIQKTRLHDLTQKVYETKRLISEKNDEKKILLARIPKTPKFFKRTDKDINIYLRIFVRELKEENVFLKAVLKKIVESKIQDMHLYKTFVDDSKTFYENSLQKVKDVSTVLTSKRNQYSETQVIPKSLNSTA